jgi:hypothetical protein
LFNVSVLGGASGQTAISLDGGNIRNAIEGNTGMNVSQEIVQEFQLSAANFDLSTGITGAGAVNIITRTGGNDFHGSGYLFFRDHNMAAYPHLQRFALAPDPFFARRQSGFWVGGPIRKEKTFFFVNFEHNNQDNALLVAPNAPAFQPLAGLFTSPYTQNNFSVRFDHRWSMNHNMFMRYSHDGNRSFGPQGTNPGALPSNWLKNTNFSDQSIIGLTSTFGAKRVNDFRVSYQYWRNRNLFPSQSDCPNCVGLGMPQMSVQGSNVVFGNTSNATQGRDLRRFEFIDSFSWQMGSHRVRFGLDIEHAPGSGFWGYADPAAGVVYGPDFMASVGLGPLLPAYRVATTMRTTADLLTMPLAGFVMGIGDPSQPPPFNFNQARTNNRYRYYAQDTWKITPRFTLNYGLAWNYESTLWNHDLDKPAILGPILGTNGLAPTKQDKNNFSPSVGIAWSVTSDNKTVLRAGAGIYYNTQLIWQRLEERSYIGPYGNGRIQVPGSRIPNPIPGLPTIPFLPAGSQQATLGALLQFDRNPTSFNLGHLVSILPQISAAAAADWVRPVSQLSLAVRGVEVAKTANNLNPMNFPSPYSEHVSVGVQRELARDWTINADFVFRQFMKQEAGVGSLDYNRFNRVNSAGQRSPVLPICTAAQQVDPKAICGSGTFTVRTPAGRANYKAMLLKVDKRFSHRFQFTSSYALTFQNGINGVNNLDNWFSTFGPQGARHSWNFSGIVDLPWKFQISFISQMSGTGPTMPSISGIDLNGDGTNGEPIPGAGYNQFNRSLGKSDLAKLVADFNARYPDIPVGQPGCPAGSAAPCRPRTIRGQSIPKLTLPANYQWGDPFFSQDLRLTKTFQWRERYKLQIMAEMFNIFNIANVGGFSMDLTNTASFGQATSRDGQVFGSGGPRALQLAVRITF